MSVLIAPSTPYRRLPRPKTTSPNRSKARRTTGSSNGIWWNVHRSYTSGPADPSSRFSIQSVAGQPSESSPTSSPMHHGVLSSATIWALRDRRSLQLWGIV
jgi:hypothetical protein